MALRPRQVLFYKDIYTSYRKNKTRATSGEATYSIKLQNRPCKHFTRPNFDTPSDAGGMAQIKVGNIMTADGMHVDLADDIAAEDYVLLTVSPNVSAKMVWFRVAGEPESRGGVANRSQVYLVPSPPPGNIV